MEISPFPHHGPLPPELVRGRDDLVVLLTEKLTARRVTALLGPRRFGKTSVLRRVSADLQDAGTAVVWVDLYEVTSMADFAIRLDSSLNAARGRFADLIGRIAASVQFSIGVARIEFAKPHRPDPTATAHVLLDLLVQAAAATPTVVFLDEFSSAGRVDGLTGLLRTKLQHHFDTIGLVFAGSEPSTMRSLFGEREQPFYGQADIVEIGPLSSDTVHELVSEGFGGTGRDAGNIAGRIYAFTGGHPRRTMQLADIAWEITSPHRAYSEEIWVAVVRELEAATDDSNEALYSSFSVAEQKVLRLAASGQSPWGRAAEVLGLNPSPATGAIAKLEAAGHLDDGDLVDPVFAHWIRRRLPA